MNRVILVLLDGLRFNIAQTSMGYLAHLVETSQASLHRVKSEIPTLSRPLYEVLLTGTPVSTNGITTNAINRLSNQVSLFHRVVQQGGVTAAAAYFWFSELYNRSPFDPLTDREQHDSSQAIQHGIFYFDDAYPDSHLFADAEFLRRNYAPHFMLVHPMGLDYIGHQWGSDSKDYEAQAIAMDSLLAQYLPLWRQAGYQVWITSDHGMNKNGLHGGDHPELREVPLFCVGEGMPLPDNHDPIPQVAIAPLIGQALSIAMG